MVEEVMNVCYYVLFHVESVHPFVANVNFETLLSLYNARVF